MLYQDRNPYHPLHDNIVIVHDFNPWSGRGRVVILTGDQIGEFLADPAKLKRLFQPRLSDLSDQSQSIIPPDTGRR